MEPVCNATGQAVSKGGEWYDGIRLCYSVINIWYPMLCRGVCDGKNQLVKETM